MPNVMYTKQELREREYIKGYRQLKKSINRYFQRGIQTKWFKMPTSPDKLSRVTEGSMRQLQKKQAEWKYYTGKKMTAEERSLLPKGIQKTKYKVKTGKKDAAGNEIYKEVDHNIGRQAQERAEARKMANKFLKAEEKRLQAEKEQEIADAVADNEFDDNDLAERNADNPEYQQALDEGYDLSDMVSQGTNEALSLINLCYVVMEDAIGHIFDSDNDRNWEQVKENCETALGYFTDAGVRENAIKFSFYLRKNSSYEEVASNLIAILYDSLQFNKSEFDEVVLNALTQEPTSMTDKDRREFEDLKEKYNFV